MKKSKRKYYIPNIEEKLRYLRVLESNDMNKSLTARQLNISRTALINYYKQYWNEYIEKRNQVNSNALEIESKKIMLSADLEKARIVIAETCQKAIHQMNTRLTINPERVKTNDLISYINTLLPYIADKKAVAGTKDSNDKSVSHTTFVQSLTQKIQQINLEKKRQELLKEQQNTG
ncbi:hypothetical protein [Maribellus mangrovi]|uniref:hypothetical protein n=1 Tax=Maribellus mangrovi TaxID=3133146 RepID=UPI0030ED3DCB